MIETESQLAALANALIGEGAWLTRAERALVPSDVSFPDGVLDEVREAIRAGEDPLGDAFSRARLPKLRRAQGATYTPKPIVDAMVAWAAGQGLTPVRVVDPGAGSGRFIFAAARAFPNAELLAVEVDPLAVLMLRANAHVLRLGHRITITQNDYRAIELPRRDGPTLFIGNPPYVRHHNIEARWKTWLKEAARQFGFTASGLAGLHIHFFVRTQQLAAPGDFGAFVTAAEWMDVNYGSVLRQMLASGLGGTAVHLIDPKALPFADALTTAAITCFRVGKRPDHVAIRAVESLADLAPLEGGRRTAWRDLKSRAAGRR